MTITGASLVVGGAAIAAGFLVGPYWRSERQRRYVTSFIVWGAITSLSLAVVGWLA